MDRLYYKKKNYPKSLFTSMKWKEPFIKENLYLICYQKPDLVALHFNSKGHTVSNSNKKKNSNYSVMVYCYVMILYCNII